MTLGAVIKEMYLRQKKLNLEICGENYTTTKCTSNGKPIRFGLALAMEAGELLDLVNWKHWGKQDKKIDINKIKSETIDIIHFLLGSLVILEDEGYVNGGFLEKLIDAKFKDSSLESITESLEESVIKISSVVLSMSTMIISVEEDGSPIENKYVASLATILGFVSLFYIKDLKTTEEELLLDYKSKNLLNMYRNKINNYNKIWNGMEDSVAVNIMVRDMPSSTDEEILDKIDNMYTSL